MTNGSKSNEPELIEWQVLRNEKISAMDEVLLEFAESVHLSISPSEKLIEKLLTVARNLKRIRVFPSCTDLVKEGSGVGTLLSQNGIEVITVGSKNSKAGKPSETSLYRDKRYFLLGLDDGRKKLLEEIKAYAPEEWTITSRYFCLDGEKRLSHSVVANLFGVSGGYLSVSIGTVLYYLDSPFEVAKQALGKAEYLEKKIQQRKEDEKEQSARQEQLTSLGLALSDLPQGMSFAYIEQFALVFHRWKYDRLNQAVTAKQRDVLILRYGLEDLQFRTLDEVGQVLKLTRERIRQIEQVAIDELRTLPKH